MIYFARYAGVLPVTFYTAIPKMFLLRYRPLFANDKRANSNKTNAMSVDKRKLLVDKKTARTRSGSYNGIAERQRIDFFEIRTSAQLGGRCPTVAILMDGQGGYFTVQQQREKKANTGTREAAG